MTEDFKKGLATGLAIGGVTVTKGGGACVHIYKVPFKAMKGGRLLKFIAPKTNGGGTECNG